MFILFIGDYHMRKGSKDKSGLTVKIPMRKTFSGLEYKARGRFTDKSFAQKIAKETRAEGYLVRIVNMKIDGKTEYIMYMRA